MVACAATICIWQTKRSSYSASVCLWTKDFAKLICFHSGSGNCVADSFQGYNADISHNVSKRLRAPSSGKRAPKKTRGPAASELPSKFGLGTAEEDVGSSVKRSKAGLGFSNEKTRGSCGCA